MVSGMLVSCICVLDKFCMSTVGVLDASSDNICITRDGSAK